MTIMLNVITLTEVSSASVMLAILGVDSSVKVLHT